jgi:hypothetical protein
MDAQRIMIRQAKFLEASNSIQIAKVFVDRKPKDGEVALRERI